MTAPSVPGPALALVARPTTPILGRVVETLVLAIAATQQAQSEASLGKLNELRAAVAGRRIDVDTT